MNDYDRIAKAIQFIRENLNRQPSLDEIATYVHLSPFHFQRLFRRWAGVSPKRFLQSLTLANAKQLLAESELSTLEVAGQLGLGSTSRLYDHFVNLEAITPSEYRSAGENVTIHHGQEESPFGRVFVGFTRRGICSLDFCDDHFDQASQTRELQRRWPNAELVEDSNGVKKLVNSVFEPAKQAGSPLSLLVQGTNFQISVWNALLRIPFGQLSTYSEIARAVGNPKAVRAVGSAVGANPIAFVIPCHRVIRSNGDLGGYAGGLTRKHAILTWESMRRECAEN
jgi:AraC family transcriptional regulator of adaptative response/methylated-DNA-[protein]-cysteine methyltransferase